jgi:biotin transport system substrate-specific component
MVRGFTMTTSAVITQRAFPRTKTVAVLLVIAAAGLTAIAAQWRIDLPFTPVPITGSTFAVLLTGAALGMRLGAAGQLLYIGLGIAGIPVFTDARSGIEVIQGATGGYIIGFVFAAGLIGWMAERRQDRTFPTMFTAFILGSGVIYLFGVIGLMASTGMGLNEALAAGVVPFVFGDIIKAVAAGILLPGAWKLVGESS